MEKPRSLKYNAIPMKKHIYIVLGFAISIVLLYFSLKGIEFREIWSTLKKTNLALAFPPLIFIATAISLSSFRWSRVAGATVRFRETFIALLIGMFVNNVLPARLGEVARGYVLSRKKRLSFTYAFSTVLLDRFFDLTGLLSPYLSYSFPGRACLLWFPRAFTRHRRARDLRLLIIVLSRESFANRLSKRFLDGREIFPFRLIRRILEVQENLKRIGSPMTIVFFVVISFCIWLSMSVAL